MLPNMCWRRARRESAEPQQPEVYDTFTRIEKLLRSEPTGAVGKLLRGTTNWQAQDHLRHNVAHILARFVYDRQAWEELNEAWGRIPFGWDLNMRSSMAQTPLHIALTAVNVHAVEFLLSKGVEINPTMDHCYYVKIFADRFRDFRCWKYQNMKMRINHIVHLLITHGIDPETQIMNYRQIFQNRRQGQFYVLEQFVAHLAYMHAQGMDAPENSIKNTIEFMKTDNILSIILRAADLDLQLVKKVVVRGTITMHKLLTGSDEQIIRAMRNEELVAFLENYDWPEEIYEQHDILGLQELRNSYYNAIIQHRAKKLLPIAKKREVALEVLCRLFEELLPELFSQSTAMTVLAERIILTFDEHDLSLLQNLPDKE